MQYGVYKGKAQCSVNMLSCCNAFRHCLCCSVEFCVDMIVFSQSHKCVIFQSLTEDVSRQMEREKELQRRYAELQRIQEELEVQ